MKILAIDPDVKKCGVCELIDGEIHDLRSISPAKLMMMIQNNIFEEYKFAIEDINKSNAVYCQKKTKNARKNESIARKIGQAQGSAIIISDFIRNKTGESPLLVPPGVGKQVKKNAKLFKQLTGWEGQTNEDKRDAWAIAIYANNKLTQSKQQKKD